MTDELEQLLEQTREETEQVAQILMLRSGYPAPRKREGAAPEMTGEAGMGAERPEDLFGMEAVGKVQAAEGGSDERSARTLYHTLTRTNRLVRAVRQPRESGRIPMMRQETAETRPEQDARWLDRIFQRDARRYDGGFTWQ